MSTINEKRVVEMQFNNTSFESNAAKTLSTINKLKESLNFSGIGNTFNEVEQAANSVKFDHLMSAVDEIANKFTYFHQAVASQFNKLVDEAFAAGKNIVKAFTIEPITSGYEEYETKLGSIQTILSNTVSRNKEVSQQAIQEINDQATAAVEAQKTVQAEQKKNLQEAQKDQDKALQKSFQAQNKAYQKQAEAQTKALEKQTQAQLKAFDEQTEGQLESVEKLYDNQYKALEKEQEKEVTKQQEAYEKKYEALVKAQAQETALLDATYEEQTKAYEKQVKEQSQVLEDRFDAETEALEKACDERYKTLEEKYDEQEDLLEKTYDEQMDTLEDYYDEQYEALEKSYEKEKKLLDKDHEDKLDMYHEEYLEKLKVADEDKYNAIKNIDNQIDSIKNLSKAEKEAQEEAEKRRKLYELELNVQNADTEYDRVKAEQRLASYRQELAEEQAEKERERQIEALEAQKDAIEEEYDLRKEQLEAEYEANKDAENELYDQKKENAEDLYKQQQKQLKDNEEKEKDALKDSLADQKKMLQQQKELEKEALDELTKQQKKALKKQQEAVKDALKEQQDLQKENLKEQYETQKENLNAQHTLQKKNLQEQSTTKLKQINEEYKAQFEALEKQRTKQLTNIKEARESQREALTEQIQAQKDALKDRQEQEQEALKERQDAQMDALNKRQEAELEALDKRHEQEMANIETEKEARIENLQKNAGKTEASSLEDVNKALDELNTYADKTIYNFSEMTRNIGTFTAAGVDLDTSVQAIKGISNLAALSGSNAQQASTAMYQLSQAIAGGTLKLEDWNSVQTAGMGGKIFQESLKETARVHGIEVDKMIAKEGSFEYSLQHGWLTNEILLETLAKFTGDMSRDQLKALGYTEEQIDGIVEIGQKAVEAATEVRTFSQLIDTTKEALGSGWTETFEIIFGNFEEATELWTGVSEIIGDVISKQADARNQLLTGWAEGGGRKKLLDSVSNLWQALLKIMEPIKAAFRDIFPPATSENLIKLTDKLKSFTASMSISTETSDKLRRVFNGVFSIVALLKNAFVAIGKVLSPFAPVVGAISDAFLTLAANLGDGISKFYEFTKSNETFQTAINGIKGGIKLVSDALVEFIHFVMSPFEKLDEAAEGSAATVKKTFDEMGIPIEKSKNIIEKARDTIVEFYEKVKSYISEKFGKIDTSFLTDFYNTVKEKVGSTEGVFGKIGAAIKAFIDAIKSFGTSLVTNLTPLKDILGSFIATSGNFLAEKMSMLMDCLSKLPNPAKAAYEGIKKLRDLIAGWLKGDFKCPVGEVFTDLSIAVDQNVGPTRLKIQKFIEDMKTFIGELSAMSKPYLDKLKEFLEPLMNLEDLESFVAIGSFLSIAKSIKGIKNAFDDAGGAIADLIDNISDAIDKVKATFGHINDFIDQLTDTVKTFQTSLKLNNFTRLSKVILTLAASVWILADAVKRLADIPKDDLIRGVAAISGLFVELSAATFLLTKFGGDAKISAMSVLALAGSMLIMQKAVQKFGQMDITQLTTGILSVMSLIAGLGLAMMAGSLGGMSFTQGAAIVALAGALLILYEAVKLFGKMDVDVMSQGLIVVGGIVAGLAYSMRFFNGFNFSAGAGIIAMATAMLILEKALKNFGKLMLLQLQEA